MTASNTQILTDRLRTRHFPGQSTEESCLSLLALKATLERQTLASRLQVLLDHQFPNGLWPSAGAGSPESGWATTIAAITLSHLSPDSDALRRALKALIGEAPQEAFWLWRLKFRIADTHVRFDPAKYGWGWVPDTVSWVIPTAMAIIALERGWRLNVVSNGWHQRVNLGYSMLLDRMCTDGGWNSGNPLVYGVALPPHFDATAIALAALRFQYPMPQVTQSLAWLVRKDCSSAYSVAWKILALQSYADIRPDVQPAIQKARHKLAGIVEDPAQVADTSSLALSILALDGEPNPFQSTR